MKIRTKKGEIKVIKRPVLIDSDYSEIVFYSGEHRFVGVIGEDCEIWERDEISHWNESDEVSHYYRNIVKTNSYLHKMELDVALKQLNILAGEWQILRQALIDILEDDDFFERNVIATKALEQINYSHK